MTQSHSGGGHFHSGGCQPRSGGCQCGAVRFRVDGPLGDASVCHCRMCQKAFGSFYAPLVSVREGTLTWTRGAPKLFQSSNAARRGFCADCGTPLTYEAPDGVAIAIGAFDAPQDIAPQIQWGVEAKLAFVDDVPALPQMPTQADHDAAAFLADLVSFQHPDHDTDRWPPA
ncbi:GFA family protein [Hyphomicrobium sp.]|uniref:GFA family protein n=1 Tax=Hyphomicrobium sp. TaxID=82 RepID=UPI003F72302B